MHSLFLNFSFSVSSNKSFGDVMSDWFQSWDTDFLSWFLPVLLVSSIIVVAIVTTVIVLQANKDRDNILGVNDLKICSRITVYAKVIDKRDSQPGKTVTDAFLHIVFECNDGQRLDFAFMPNDTKYHSIVIGDKGSLTYAGKAFVDFQRIVDARQSQ